MLESINPSGTLAWKKLREHYGQMEFVQMQKLFAKDPERANKMNIQWEDFLLDYSKNKITEETINILLELANELNLKEAIQAMYKGDIINATEKRAVLHTALRDLSPNSSVLVQGENVLTEIQETRKRIKAFTTKVLNGSYTSYSGKKFTDVINVGIGGSDLGPKMVVHALANYRTELGMHYISNVDDDYLQSVLNKLNPETTLVLIVSKTFTTQETIENAKKIKSWLEGHLGTIDLSAHYVGVSVAIEEAMSFGVKRENIYPMWDFVGGRFSLWSAVGISIALAVGYDHFEELLEGAYAMDIHFKEADFKDNLPVVMALLSVWYNNFYGYETEAVVPYSQLLGKLPAHLQQMIMESNGKNKDRSGAPVNYQTGTLIWGEVGVSAQHAFFQLFHQGTKVIPIDFIGFVNPHFKESTNHDILMSNFFGQSEALLNGKIGEEYESDGGPFLSNFREFCGNKPSNTILIDKLTPKSLGELIALYEHKTFVQGVIWNIYSFDQFGVEYGKILAKNIQNEIKSKNICEHDSSTAFLLRYFVKNRVVE
ncbi:glucose-6-phosphate isomerase [Myroides odoratimimus]|uniref:glucose-6-phosphate isomerase n=1 Tax=Myroides odoratimimus TaxID=76832 RepID=UPI002574B222|nr:glucose-6-phosphate isomerase [Myroides odoratimimus]MDM1515895.1 glucose-6-phosphate isomerase [Myroides odoratimimus]MDM1535573.1 glucose-6-phosphate isomerase [Myroides odoratimimus]MDM1675146.1 glucose-6-phosphate isomerase [Myroides odoratimimus]